MHLLEQRTPCRQLDKGRNPLCSDLPLSLGGARTLAKAGDLTRRPRDRDRITVAGQCRVLTGFALSPFRGTFTNLYSIVVVL